MIVSCTICTDGDVTTRTQIVSQMESGGISMTEMDDAIATAIFASLHDHCRTGSRVLKIVELIRRSAINNCKE